MKRWFALVTFLSLLLIAFAGCAGGDSSSDGGGFGKDGGGKDGAANDGAIDDGSTGDSSVTDSGEDSGIDSGFDAGVDSGPPFIVTVAASTNDVTATVTFSDAPNATQANDFTHYAIAGLTVSAASLSGNVVTLTTTTQTATSFTVTVTGVTRASDTAALATNAATFTGHPIFNVTSAVATSATSVTVTFDGAPNTTSGSAPLNYVITGGSGLAVSAAVPSGNTVVLTTAVQSAASFTLTVTGVTRASDGEPLTTNSAIFTGIPPFDVTSAIATSLTTVDVAFDAPPDSTTGNLPANYSIPGLTISGAAVSGSIVTLTTNKQSAITYDVTVSNVLRASDLIGLSASNSALFAQAGPGVPSVGVVSVASTLTDNGSIPYNTGTSTLTITGTDFNGIACLTAVKLDDLDGLGGAVGTKPTACTVDTNTQITATFPAGIRTNGSTGWNVLVTNTFGTNTASDLKFVPKAGLLISEILTGTTASTTHEYIEIYNPTTAAIDTAALGLKYHTRSSGGGDAGNHPVTSVRTLVIQPGGFLLFATAVSTGETWSGIIDATYVTTGLAANGSAYLSLSTTSGAKVIDKVGWGTQPAGGFEGTATDDIPNTQSIQRISAATPTTDNDVNSTDFNASGTPSPTGSAP
jgi:hypothetical protein